MMAVFKSFLVFVVFAFLLLVLIVDSQSSSEPVEKRNLLSEGRITAFAPNDTQCCVAENCSHGIPFCAVDDNLTTIWTLTSKTAYIVIQLNASSLVSEVSVILGPTSVIPSSIVVTASGTNIKWTTYFNDTCQPNDEYLRRKDSQYYSCQRSGQTNLTVSVPDGLFSIRNGSSAGWLWWQTFQQFQLTIEATDADYAKPNASGSIEIADVQLYGWVEPTTGCNCHPVGVTDVEMPCRPTDGECICRSTTTPNSQCIPSFTDIPGTTTSALPTYGPLSGGTTVFTTGYYLANVTKVTIGDDYDCTIIRNNDTRIDIKTSAGSDSDLRSSIPVRINWERPDGIVSSIIANWEFTFRPDPIINSTSPLTSILSGGIRQTVTGENLDSVAYPFITLVITGATTPYYANFTNSYLAINDTFCHHINSTRLECITPGTANYDIFPHEVVTLTISMDINKYNNYTKCEVTDGQCKFIRTENPKIYEWEEKPMIYNVYDGKKSFTIQGNNFLVGSREDDYRLTVEGVQCENVDIITNLITFNPPDPSMFANVDNSKQTILYVGYYSYTVGYLQYYLSWIDNPVNRNGLIIGLVCGVGGLVIIILIIVLYRTYYKSKKAPLHRPSHPVHYNIEESRYTRGPHRDPTLLECLSEEQRAKVEKVLVDPSRIQVEEQIGSGNFGEVYSGLFCKTDDEIEHVAIKTIRKNPVVEFQDKVSFIEEATIMIDFSHRNVLSLIAVYIENDFPYVILPLMENGDLREFVSNTKKHFSVLDLTSYSLQVAEGMKYLAENKFIHRDLAARNCMINKEFVVKVADFGLARDIFEKDYYRPSDANRPLPFKWMPIECLAGVSKFSESSDVWSFGVLMWELFTRGRRPYADIENSYLKQFLMRGGRLEQPNHTPQFIYDLMLSCWKETPTKRPNFKEIVISLQEILAHAPDNNRASVASFDSVDETTNANQIHLQIRKDGPVSYLDLTQNVPGFYSQQSKDDEPSQDVSLSNPRSMLQVPRHNVHQAQEDERATFQTTQVDPGSDVEQVPDYDDSDVEQMQDGTGIKRNSKQHASGSSDNQKRQSVA